MVAECKTKWRNFFCCSSVSQLSKVSRRKVRFHKILFPTDLILKTQAALHGHAGQTIAIHLTSVICPLLKMASSTRNARTQPIPMEHGVLPSHTGAREGKNILVILAARIKAMAGISVETMGRGHSTAHMVSWCPVAHPLLKKHTSWPFSLFDSDFASCHYRRAP